MVCPRCKIEAKIARTKYVTINDDTPNKPTELFIEQEFKCRNPQCSDFQKVVGTKRNPLEVNEDKEQS